MKAKKSLGQNFLIDKQIIQKISNVIRATKDDLIIEIGPGRGALTKTLKLKNAQLICYEIDEELKPFLTPLEDSKTKIIYKDILTSNIIDDIKNLKYDKLYIVGNLPYYITTPIIKHLINLNLNIEEMIFMVQEEVADRFTALPKSRDYGSITLYLKYYFNVTKLFTVSKNAFNPIPKVESAIISFSKRSDTLPVNKDKYFALINDAFRMKRKTLKNNLANYDWPNIERVLMHYNLSSNVRAEELDEWFFVKLVNSLEGKSYE